MSDLSLEIHHLDVHGGDAAAIFVRNMANGGELIYSVLIDAGTEKRGSAYLKKHLTEHHPTPFDLVVATHYHQDHIQGFHVAGIQFKKFLDNGGYTDGKGETPPRHGIGKGAKTGVFESYVTQVQLQVKERQAERIPIPFIPKSFDLVAAKRDSTVKPLVVELGENTGITLTCHCASGILADGTDVLGSQKDKKEKTVGPNDISLALLLEWGDFRYLTAGDLSGDPEISSYYNIEEKLVDYLAAGPLKNKNLTAFKASHHGSEHSNQPALLSKLEPETIIVCCNIMKQVPSPVFLNRLVTYFESRPEARVVFNNTLLLHDEDDRYQPLKDIEKNIANGNVAFKVGGKEKQTASNLGIKYSIIRRRVRDGQPVEYVDENKPDGVKVTKMQGYDIVLMPRDAEEEKTLEATRKFRSWVMQQAWREAECTQDQIFAAFKIQAGVMVDWLVKDAKQAASRGGSESGGTPGEEPGDGMDVEGEQSGSDHIAMFYPGLVKVIADVELDTQAEQDRVKAALVDEMESLFKQSFILVPDPGGDPGGALYQRNNNNQLTSDQKMTIFMLLIGNSYQVALNTALKPGGGKTRTGQVAKKSFDQAEGWNRKLVTEPYAGVKRKAGLKKLEDVPRSKKSKQW